MTRITVAVALVACACVAIWLYFHAGNRARQAVDEGASSEAPSRFPMLSGTAAQEADSLLAKGLAASNERTTAQRGLPAAGSVWAREQVALLLAETTSVEVFQESKAAAALIAAYSAAELARIARALHDDLARVEGADLEAPARQWYKQDLLVRILQLRPGLSLLLESLFAPASESHERSLAAVLSDSRIAAADEPELRRLFRSEFRSVRLGVVEGLARAGTFASADLDATLDLLEPDDPAETVESVMRTLALAMLEAGSKGRDMLSASAASILRPLVYGDGKAEVRGWAVYVLSAGGGITVDEMVELLSTTADPLVWQRAFGALAMFQPEGVLAAYEAAPSETRRRMAKSFQQKLYWDKFHHIRRNVAATVARKWLDDPDPLIQFYAAVPIVAYELDVEPDRALEVLQSGLAHGTAEQRVEALVALLENVAVLRAQRAHIERLRESPGEVGQLAHRALVRLDRIQDAER